jgi:hypothetical protein
MTVRAPRKRTRFRQLAGGPGGPLVPCVRCDWASSRGRRRSREIRQSHRMGAGRARKNRGTSRSRARTLSPCVHTAGLEPGTPSHCVRTRQLWVWHPFTLCADPPALGLAPFHTVFGPAGTNSGTLSHCVRTRRNQFRHPFTLCADPPEPIPAPFHTVCGPAGTNSGTLSHCFQPSSPLAGHPDKKRGGGRGRGNRLFEVLASRHAPIPAHGGTRFTRRRRRQAARPTHRRRARRRTGACAREGRRRTGPACACRAGRCCGSGPRSRHTD